MRNDSKNLIENCSVIIRSTGERTEELCKYSIIQNGINRNNIFLISNIYPFSEALKKGYELAYKINKPYTFFVDADMILFKDALSLMLYAMDKLPDQLFFANPLVYDYLTGHIVSNGPHLYKTKYLDKAIEFIPKENISLRPETYATKKMRTSGYKLLYIDVPVALHEFEQYYKDIFRRVFNKYHKFPKNFALEDRFLKLKDQNKDFEVAYHALVYAQVHNITLKLDYRQFDGIFKGYNVVEKEKIENLEKTYEELINFAGKEKNNFIYSGYSEKLFIQEQQFSSKNTFGCLISKVLKFLKSS